MLKIHINIKILPKILMQNIYYKIFIPHNRAFTDLH